MSATDTFFPPDAVFGVGHVDRVGGAPGLQDLLFRHADHDLAAGDVLFKRGVEEAWHKPEGQHAEKKDREKRVDGEAHRPAAQKGSLVVRSSRPGVVGVIG